MWKCQRNQEEKKGKKEKEEKSKKSLGCAILQRLVPLQSNWTSLVYKVSCLRKEGQTEGRTEGMKEGRLFPDAHAWSIPIRGRGVQSLELACDVLSSSSLSQEWKPLVRSSSVNSRWSVKEIKRLLLRQSPAGPCCPHLQSQVLWPGWSIWWDIHRFLRQKTKPRKAQKKHTHTSVIPAPGRHRHWKPAWPIKNSEFRTSLG